mgnify:CR=1 FL=1
MTKAQIIEKVSEQVSLLTKRQAEIVVNTLFNSVRDSLHRGEDGRGADHHHQRVHPV